MTLDTSTLRALRAAGAPDEWFTDGPGEWHDEVVDAKGDLIADTYVPQNAALIAAAVNALGPACDEIDRLRADLDAARSLADVRLTALRKAENDVHLLRGALEAQMERERRAGESCGVPATHGCDWPEDVADEVQRLRAELLDRDARLADLQARYDNNRRTMLALARNGCETPKEG